ncbi:MAG: hypothetical protein IKC77_10350 [Lentisphaeria bacterium]|nr:hypothetical protein [Lentisphaeria bacterium]
MKMKLFLLLLAAVFVLTASADSRKTLVKNYNSIYSHGNADLKKADALLADMNSDGSFKSVLYGDKSRGLWKGMAHWYNLRTLVAAWRKTADRKYCDAVNAGLIWWGKTLPENSNWWWQEIGVPMHLIRVINNMNGAVSPEALEASRKTFERAALRGTGQNLADAAIIHLWKGVFYNDDKMVNTAVDALKSVVKISPAGKEGLQADYSFHQHGSQQQFGNYGRGYYENCTLLLRLLDGTEYAFSKAQQELIWNYFYCGLRWTLFKNQMDYLACGRQITHDAPYGKCRQIKGYSRRFNNSKEKRDIVEAVSRNDASLEGSRYFFRSDYLIHRRKDFYFSYKMCSSRVIGSETINKENLQGLYLGCGVMQYKTDGSEYDNMAALWDWRRLPGLTAVYDNDSLNASRARKKTNISSTVGAVTDEVNTGVMMGCSSSKIGYFKSVTAIDKCVVFNLNNVVNKTKSPVNTTIDSRLYRTPVEVVSAGKKQVYENGTHKLEKVEKIIHDNVAYTFLKPQNLTLAIEEKSVPWKSVTIHAKGVQKGKTVTIYVNHGVKAKNERLSYMIAPAGENTGVKTIFNKCGHVVKDSRNDTCWAYFFVPGEMDIPGVGKLSSDKKAAVMLKKDTLTVADVQQKNRVVNISLNDKLYKFVTPSGVYAGKSVTLSK